MAKMGELKRAAQRLGVTSTTLRKQGWKTASPERVRAVAENPPEWLIQERLRRSLQQEKRRQMQNRQATARRLGITVREVKAREIAPEEVHGLLDEKPDWLVAAQQHRRTAVERQAKDRLRAELTDTLVTSVYEVWFQELKYADTDADVDEIDARWAPEVDKAKAEAWRMIEELGVEQVRSRIHREEESAREAGVYRAAELARRAFGGHGG